MKHTIQFSLGYLGYFLIMFMALRAILIQNDQVSFVILVIGSFLLMNYGQSLEKRYGSPKYGGYIKLILVIAFLVSGLIVFI